MSAGDNQNPRVHSGSIKEDIVELEKMPDPNCPKCKGVGHGNRMLLEDGVYRYRPCECTERTERTEQQA